MSDGYRFRLALEPDIAEIMAIFEGRREWLRDTKISDQWSGVAQWRRLMVHLIRQGDVWVLVTADDQDDIVGTVTVSLRGDVQFWTEHERTERAIYISKLATAVDHKGQELGSLLLDHVVEYAHRRGIGRIRFDTWKTSPELQEYYRRRGWRHVRTAQLEHRESGALFERRVRAPRVSRAARTVQRFALASR